MSSRRRVAGKGRRGAILTTRQDDGEDARRPSPRPSGQVRRVKVSELLAGEREAILEHDGQDYRLRITATGKLILTK